MPPCVPLSLVDVLEHGSPASERCSPSAALSVGSLVGTPPSQGEGGLAGGARKLSLFESLGPELSPRWSAPTAPGTTASASPVGSGAGTPTSRCSGAVPGALRPLSLFDSLSDEFPCWRAPAELSPCTLPAEPPAEQPARLLLFESLLAAHPALQTGLGSSSAAALGPPPGLAPPPGLEDVLVQPLAERSACSALSDGCQSATSTAVGSARIGDQESSFAGLSPESRALADSPSPAFGTPRALSEAELFGISLSALLGPPPVDAPVLAPTMQPPSPPPHAAHDPAECRPCAWFWKEVGCKNADDCQYCHTCPPGALKDKKKERRAGLRADQAPKPPATPDAQRHSIRLAALL